MMLFHIIMETWHLDTAIFYFLLLLFILWSAAILHKQSSKQMLGFCPFFFLLLLDSYLLFLYSHEVQYLIECKTKKLNFPPFNFFFGKSAFCLVSLARRGDWQELHKEYTSLSSFGDPASTVRINKIWLPVFWWNNLSLFFFFLCFEA